MKLPKETCEFSAKVLTDDDTEPDVNWTVAESTDNNTTIDQGKGRLTIGTNETGQLKVTATVKDTSVSNSVTVKVTRVKIIPSDVQMKRAGDKIQFGAKVFTDNDPEPNVNWTVAGRTDNNTTIDKGNGLLTIGPDETGQLKVTATVNDTLLSNSVTVIVSAKDPNSETVVAALGNWILAYLESNPDNTPQQAMAAMVPVVPAVSVATDESSPDGRIHKNSSVDDIVWNDYSWNMSSIGATIEEMSFAFTTQGVTAVEGSATAAEASFTAATASFAAAAADITAIKTELTKTGFQSGGRLASA
jgi:hypothetical protein